MHWTVLELKYRRDTWLLNIFRALVKLDETVGYELKHDYPIEGPGLQNVRQKGDLLLLRHRTFYRTFYMTLVKRSDWRRMSNQSKRCICMWIRYKSLEMERDSQGHCGPTIYTRTWSSWSRGQKWTRIETQNWAKSCCWKSFLLRKLLHVRRK